VKRLPLKSFNTSIERKMERGRVKKRGKERGRVKKRGKEREIKKIERER